jgi:hypothetical protein
LTGRPDRCRVTPRPELVHDLAGRVEWLFRPAAPAKREFAVFVNFFETMTAIRERRVRRLLDLSDFV